MRVSRFRRPAVVLTALAALIAAPLTEAPTATAADPPRSSVNASEPPTNDTVKGDPPAPANEPSSNITAASARYQNDFVTFTMKLENATASPIPGACSSGRSPRAARAAASNFVSLKKTTSGLQVVMGNPEAPIDPKDASQKCSNSS